MKSFVSFLVFLIILQFLPQDSAGAGTVQINGLQIINYSSSCYSSSNSTIFSNFSFVRSELFAQNHQTGEFSYVGGDMFSSLESSLSKALKETVSKKNDSEAPLCQVTIVGRGNSEDEDVTISYSTPSKSSRISQTDKTFAKALSSLKWIHPPVSPYQFKSITWSRGAYTESGNQLVESYTYFPTGKIHSQRLIQDPINPHIETEDGYLKSSLLLHHHLVDIISEKTLLRQTRFGERVLGDSGIILKFVWEIDNSTNTNTEEVEIEINELESLPDDLRRAEIFFSDLHTFGSYGIVDITDWRALLAIVVVSSVATIFVFGMAVLLVAKIREAKDRVPARSIAPIEMGQIDFRILDEKDMDV